MSDYDEDVFFDEEDEKEKIEKEIISEDDFDEDFQGEDRKKAVYRNTTEAEEDEFSEDFDVTDTADEDFDDSEEISVTDEKIKQDPPACDGKEGKITEANDFREVKPGEDVQNGDEPENVADENREACEGTVEDTEEEDEDDSPYEDVCFVCRRPESVTGKQFKLPNNICVCNDCMHKTMDAVSQFDYQGMLDPSMLAQSMNQSDLSDLSKKFPNISFVNLQICREMVVFRTSRNSRRKRKNRMISRCWISKIFHRHTRSRLSWMILWSDRIMPRRLFLLRFTIIINEWQPIQWMISRSKSPIC